MNWISKIALWTGKLTGWGFFLIVLLMCYEVVARYGFNAPTIWAHEIAGVVAAIAFVFGGAYCMAENSHMRITALSDRFGPRLSSISSLLSWLAGLVYLAGLAFAAYRMAEKSYFRFLPDGTWDPERSGSTWNTPAPSIIKFALFVGTVLFLAVLLARIVNRLKNKSEPG